MVYFCHSTCFAQQWQRLLGCTDRRVAPGIRRTRAAAAGAGGADCFRQVLAVVGVPAVLTAPSWGGLAAPPGPVIC